jgi:hypothetical protein
MVEAIHSVAQAQRLAQRKLQAVRVLCERRAQEEIEDQIRREGRVKLRSVPRREIIDMARAKVFADTAYRAKLIAEAKAIVERWQWGPRGGLRIT